MNERDIQAMKVVDKNEFALVEEKVVEKLFREKLIEEFYTGESSDVRLTEKGKHMLKCWEGAGRTCHW